MHIKTIAIFMYGLIGIIFLIVSVFVLLVPTGILPNSITEIVFEFGKHNPYTMHIIQELSSLLLFVGLISLWFSRHYELSLFYHWAMTAFFAYFALVHWISIDGGWNKTLGPLINTIPFLLFLVLGLCRMGKLVEKDEK